MDFVFFGFVFFIYLFEVWFGNLVSTAIDYEYILRKVNYIYSLLTTLYLISFSNSYLMPNFIYRLHDISLNQSQRKLQRKPQRKFCFKIARDITNYPNLTIKFIDLNLFLFRFECLLYDSQFTI